MACFPGMYYGGYTAYGSSDGDIHCQVIITSHGAIERSTYYFSYAPLPGIY